MSASPPNRQPAGISTGGQFAPKSTAEALLDLQAHETQNSRDHNVVEPQEPGSPANRRSRDSVTEIVTVPPSFHQVPVVDRDATPPAEVAAVYLLDPPLYGSLGDTDALFFATDRYSDGTVNGYLAAPTGSGVPSCTREFREQDIAMLGAMAAEYRPGRLHWSEAVRIGKAIGPGAGVAEVLEAISV